MKNYRKPRTGEGGLWNRDGFQSQLRVGKVLAPPQRLS